MLPAKIFRWTQTRNSSFKASEYAASASSKRRSWASWSPSAWRGCHWVWTSITRDAGTAWSLPDVDRRVSDWPV